MKTVSDFSPSGTDFSFFRQGKGYFLPEAAEKYPDFNFL